VLPADAAGLIATIIEAIEDVSDDGFPRATCYSPVLRPAWFIFASAIAGANALLEEGRGAESFTIGLLHDLLGLAHTSSTSRHP